MYLLLDVVLTSPLWRISLQRQRFYNQGCGEKDKSDCSNQPSEPAHSDFSHRRENQKNC